MVADLLSFVKSPVKNILDEKYNKAAVVINEGE